MNGSDIAQPGGANAVYSRGNIKMFGARRLHISESGAVAVEGTIALPLYFLLVFAVLQFCIACYSFLSLQFVATNVMRTVTLSPTMTGGELRSRISDRLLVFGIELKPTDAITLCPVETYGSANCPANTVVTGVERQLMVLHIRQSFSSFLHEIFPAPFHLNAEVLGRIEPV